MPVSVTYDGTSEDDYRAVSEAWNFVISALGCRKADKVRLFKWPCGPASRVWYVLSILKIDMRTAAPQIKKDRQEGAQCVQSQSWPYYVLSCWSWSVLMGASDVEFHLSRALKVITATSRVCSRAC